MSLLEVLKNRPGFEFLATLDGDRHLFRVPTAAVEEHPDLVNLRGNAREEVDKLQASQKRTGGTSIYPITVYAELDAQSSVHLYVADGHQRLRAERQNANNRVIVQYISRWDTVREAFQEAIDLNFARYEVGEDDLISILRTGKLTVAEVAQHTGYSETTVRDFSKVAKHSWAGDLIRAKAIGRTKLTKLLDACGNSVRKLDALGNSLSAHLADATQKAEEVKTRIKEDKKRAASPRLKERANIAFYFKDLDWDAWESALEEDQVPVEERDGRLYLKVDGAGRGKAAAPFVGAAREWETDIALYDFAGHKVDDILTEDLQDILDQWDQMGGYLKAHLTRRRREEVAAAIPMPASEPDATRPPDPPPTEQTPQAKVVRRPRVD